VRKDIGALVYLPEEKKIESYQSDNLESFTEIDDYWMKREGLVFYPFDRSKQAFFFAKDKKESRPLEFEFSPNDSLTKAEYETSVFLAQQSIADGDFTKVILARNHIMTGDYSPENAFQKAVTIYPDSFGYYVNLGEQQWVGASPELLLHFRENVIYTIALAGTQPLDGEFTTKEHVEQQLVEDFIEEKLLKMGLTNFVKSEKQEARFKTIKHLKTAYTTSADANSALELLKHLQPTSAVCGLPRDASFGFIQEFETMNRSFYSGVTGVLRKDSATFFVNLRCMRFYGKSVELFAGAGITADSNATAEWEETEKKIATIKELL
jgi:isochorismate synthase